MIIKSIELKNFRNYREQKLCFDEKTNIFYGDNAQGKTNILEAVYLSGTTKSHKGSKDRDMIRFGEDEAHLRTFVKKKETDYQIDIHLKKTGRKESLSTEYLFEKQVNSSESQILFFFHPRIWELSSRGLPKDEGFSTWNCASLTGFICTIWVNTTAL